MASPGAVTAQRPRSNASARMLCSPVRSPRASSPGSSDVRIDNERPGPRSWPSKSPSLTPDLAHGAVAGLLGEGEASCRLYARRLPQHFVDRRYGVFRADGVLYGDVEVGEEARVDLAVRCEPEPAATGAEGFRDRRYDAEGAGGAIEAELVCGGCGVFLFDRFEVPQLLSGAVQDLTPGDEERAEARAVGVAVQGHQFYEPDVHGIPQRKLRHVCDLIVVHAAHCDGVDLDRRKGRLERRHHRLPDLLEVVGPRYEGELLGLEGIEGDVDTVEASFDEAIQVLLE